MTAQVIFLKTFYYPDQEERARLENLQDHLTYSNSNYYFRRKDLPIGLVKALKDEVHRRAREQITILSSFS